MGEWGSWQWPDLDWPPWKTATADARDGPCRCRTRVADGRLMVDADDCPGSGDLAASPACRATVVDALAGGGFTPICVRHRGFEATYADDAATLFTAAGRFVARARAHDERIAERAKRDPLEAGTDATTRAGPVADVANATGLTEAAECHDDYEHVLAPLVGSVVSDARLRPIPPRNATLIERRTTLTDAIVRRFETPGEDLPTYHLTPVECRLGDDAMATLANAHDLLASGAVTGNRAAHEAVVRATDGDVPVETLVRILEKHTSDLGVLVDCFADQTVSDVFATAPIPETPLCVRVDGELARTNVRLSARGARALASRLRLESGRAFSRASPTLDAATTAGDRRIRVAGTCEPVSEGYTYALRAHEPDPWTVERLVGNGTLTPAVAALLSVAVERAAAILVAGTRGAGKTTLLGGLLFELPTEVRTLVIEDTPELPIEALQDRGRDVQSLLTESGDGPGLPAEEALRTGLRLGEGALVLGEVRGEEAAVLYEAMRVGASGSAVLGTIHGDGPTDVRERVVEDLDVPESSFATTDLVVTLGLSDDGEDSRRRVESVTEVAGGEDGVRFAPLFERDEAGLVPTGRIDRGNSRLLASLAGPDERYADVRSALGDRRARFAETAAVGVDTPEVAPAWSG